MRRTRVRAPIVVDAAALQSPMSRGRGIARYAAQWALALERARPDLVAAYVLDPALAPPELDEELVATGKFVYLDETGDVLREARHVHSLSPFDLNVGLETLWPGLGPATTFSATVYDLIPARDRDTELADPLVRRRYQTRLELVRAADQLHVISRHVGNELSALLHIAPERLVYALAAPAPHFTPDTSARALAPAEALLGGPGRPFVLAPGGSHPRKNIERLVTAFGELSEAVRTSFRLVVTGAIPPLTANHYRHLAGEGHFSDRLVVTGELADPVLLSCYRAATLVCFPSLAEGYGLPVAEAIACGTPVVAADRPPFDELLDGDARFDPSTTTSIAAAVESALTHPGALHAIKEAARPPGNYAQAAAASARGFDAVLATTPRPKRVPPRIPGASRGTTAKLRVALVSPFPPAPSGIATYSYRLAEALVQTGEASVDAFVDGPTPGQISPEGVPAHHVAALPTLERLFGAYDGIVYAFGNSHHHLGALDLLRRRSGIVIAHDVRLANCYHHETGDPAFTPGGFRRALAAHYPEPGLRLSQDTRHDDELARHGPLFAREVIARAQHFLVASPAAAALARLDARPDDTGKIAVLPFAIEDPERHQALFDPSGGDVAPPELVGNPLVCHFGIVDPVKLPDTLLDACVRLRATYPDLRCAFVGPIADDLAEALRARAAELGFTDGLVLSGALSAPAYRAALSLATVAVQLRAQFNGEASAAVGECLSCGVPTIVSRIGWARDLPATAVVALDTPVDTESLADALDKLLGDPAQREALAKAGRQEAERRSFARTAHALLEIVRQRRA